MERINEIIEIIEKTGDKCIILKDSAAFVVMKFDDYKKLLEPINTGKAVKIDSAFNRTGQVNIKDFEIPEEDLYYPEPID